MPLARLEAATSLENIHVSPDITVALGAAVVEDEAVVIDDLQGTVVPVSVGSIPRYADLDAYHLMPNGDRILSFDTTVELSGGLTVGPGDVVRFDGASYSIEFSSTAEGVPNGANLDAVTTFAGSLVLSFDVTVDLGGLRVDDEDLVLFDGIGFSLFFDGSTVGVGGELDLDAVDYLECNGHLLLSFDGSGAIGALAFDDDDVLEYDRNATWEMAYDGSALHPAWRSGDLDALHATADPGPGPPLVFGQTVLAAAGKVNYVWPNPVAFRGVRGSFAMPGDIGNYDVDETYSGNGTFLSDPSVPTSGSGYWYLVKPRVCLLSSWQTTVGAEPGRDAAIP